MNKMQAEPIAAAEAAEKPKRKRARKDGGKNWTRTVIMLIVPALLLLVLVMYVRPQGLFGRR